MTQPPPHRNGVKPSCPQAPRMSTAQLVGGDCGQLFGPFYADPRRETVEFKLSSPDHQIEWIQEGPRFMLYVSVGDVMLIRSITTIVVM